MKKRYAILVSILLAVCVNGAIYIGSVSAALTGDDTKEKEEPTPVIVNEPTQDSYDTGLAAAVQTRQTEEGVAVDDYTSGGSGGLGTNAGATRAGNNAEHNISTKSTGWIKIPASEFDANGELHWHSDYFGDTILHIEPGADYVVALFAIGQWDGKPLAPISFANNLAKAWNSRTEGGYADYNSAAADFSVEEVRTLFNQAQAAGLLPTNLTFDEWLKQVESGHFSITDDLLNPCTENCDDDPEDPDEPEPIIVTPPPSTPSCHNGEHWGDTEGSVSVMNMTTGTGWLKEGTIYARPGDTIRFATYFCWGAQAVAGSNGSSTSPFARTDDWAGQTWFQMSAERGPNYLFGEDAQFIGTSRHVLTSPHNSTIGATGSGVDDGHVEWTRDYSFLMYSPSNKGSDSTRYNCQVFDFSPFFINYGFQIPGIATDGCSAASNTGNMSDVGYTISQTLQYHKVQAWQLWKHTETGGCSSCCDYLVDETWVNCGDEQAVRNTWFRQNYNLHREPFGSLAEAQAANSANAWGFSNEHMDDVAPHEHDCHRENGCGCRDHTITRSSGCHSYCDGSTDRITGDCLGTTRHVNSLYPASCDYGDTSSWNSCGDDSGGSDSAHCVPDGHRYYKDYDYDYSTEYSYAHPVNRGDPSSTATVLIPYNYRTDATAYLQASEVIYAGQSVSSSFSVDIYPRINTSVRPGEAYATILDGEIRAVEFIVSADSSPNVEGSSNAGDQDPCAYYGSRMNIISECNPIWTESGGLNPEGRYAGKHYDGGAVQVIPDATKYEPGSKYCVAVGISHSDSHGVPDAYTVSGMSSPSGWRISGASCRTIAKKPNFQVWNGGLYTNGSITTSIARKDVGSELGESYNPDAIFGSWDEYYVIARKSVFNFASGAAFGYYGKEINTSLGLMGGSSPNATNCQITRMTISNEDCGNSKTGNSQVTNSVDSLLSRIYSRYTNATLPNGMNTLANGARYYKQTSGFSTSAIGNPIRQDKSTVDTDSQQTTSNYASNLLVIHSTGKITIDTNICDGDGSCNSETNTLQLGARNNNVYNSIYSLPQVIIIAEGGIDITANVTQIDAWLITPTGRVNTCTNFHLGSSDMHSCPNTLIVNGPIIAKSMSLGRTGGAFNGAGSFNTSDVLYKDLANSGSITPAEIMNLRPDVLYWAYGQAQRYSQAAVTYTRELAPRY